MVAIPLCIFIHNKGAWSSGVGHRVNVVIDDEVWDILQTVPKGERSRAVNQALMEWAIRRRRETAASEMDRVRSTLPRVDAETLTNWIREDRDRPPR